MRGRVLQALAVGLAFVFLGTAWSFASPPGSTNDEEYHLANVWCAWGEWEGCQFSPPAEELAAGAVADGSVWIPGFLRDVNCYQRGSQSTACLEGKDSQLVNSYRQSYGYNPSTYYVVMRTLAWSNDQSSLQLIRLFNVALTGILVGLAVFVSKSSVRRGIVLAWGIAAIPWLVIYASSTNPSAWAIAGVGTVWAFGLSTLDRENPRSLRWVALGGLIFATVVAISGRFDSFAWLALALVSILVYSIGSQRFHVTRALAAGLAIAVAVTAIAAVQLNRQRLGFMSFGIPEWNRATDQPHPLLKDLLEIPWWDSSWFGAQPPVWIPSNGEPLTLRDGFVPIGIGVNLGDSFFPSAVGYLLGFAALAVVFASIPRFARRNWAILAGLSLALVTIMIAFRAKTDFVVVASMQGRYFLPWLMIFLAAALTIESRKRALLSRGQVMVVSAMLILGGSLAWLAFAGRYAVNLSGTFTNFGQEPVWWWAWGPSRLVWFLIAAVATVSWVVVTLRYAVRPLRDLKEPERSGDRVP